MGVFKRKAPQLQPHIHSPLSGRGGQGPPPHDYLPLPFLVTFSFRLEYKTSALLAPGTFPQRPHLCDYSCDSPVMPFLGDVHTRFTASVTSYPEDASCAQLESSSVLNCARGVLPTGRICLRKVVGSPPGGRGADCISSSWYHLCLAKCLWHVIGVTRVAHLTV